MDCVLMLTMTSLIVATCARNDMVRAIASVFVVMTVVIMIATRLIGMAFGIEVE